MGGQGRAISAEFERPDGNKPAHYEVKVVYTDGRLVEHDLDANTGQIIKSENRLKPAARTSLRDAIALAEQRMGAGARAIEADVDREGSSIEPLVPEPPATVTPVMVRRLRHRVLSRSTLQQRILLNSRRIEL